MTDRPFDHRTHIFPLQILPHSKVTLYVRTQTAGSTTLPLKLWTPEKFAQHASYEMYAIGIYVGVLLGLICYNLFVYHTIREKTYALYSLFMLCVLAFFLSVQGVGQQMIWSSMAWVAHPMIAFTVSISVGFGALFSAEFLHTKDFSPLIDRALRMLGKVSIGAALLAWVMPYHISVIVAVMLGFIACVMSFSAGFFGYMRKQHAAGLYLAAWTFFLIGTGLNLSRVSGFVPSNMFTEYAQFLGSAAEGILLSVALAARMRALREANEAAERRIRQQEKMANLGLLSSGVAHEIANPNNFVNISADNMRYDLRDFEKMVSDMLDDESDPAVRQAFKEQFDRLNNHVDLVKEGSERIAGIVKSMRNVSRSDDNGEKQRFDPVDSLSHTVQLVKASYKTVANFDDNGLKAHAQVVGFASQVNQVFTNLLVNACHAIEEKQRKFALREPGRVLLTSEINEREILISIQDTGCGMPDEVKQRLFEPFFTTKGSEKGTGLGMGICKGIIDAHGGRLEIKSEVDRGTCMTVVLPRAA